MFPWPAWSSRAAGMCPNLSSPLHLLVTEKHYCKGYYLSTSLIYPFPNAHDFRKVKIYRKEKGFGIARRRHVWLQGCPGQLPGGRRQASRAVAGDAEHPKPEFVGFSRGFSFRSRLLSSGAELKPGAGAGQVRCLQSQDFPLPGTVLYSQ